MRRHPTLSALIGFVIILLVGCNSGDAATDDATTVAAPTTTTTAFAVTIEPVNPADQLIGEWVTEASHVVSFNEDGTWGGSTGRGFAPFDAGPYTFEDGIMTVNTELARSCPEGAVGRYEVTFTDEGNLKLSSLGDECSDRSSDWRSELIPYPDDGGN